MCRLYRKTQLLSQMRNLTVYNFPHAPVKTNLQYNFYAIPLLSTSSSIYRCFVVRTTIYSTVHIPCQMTYCKYERGPVKTNLQYNFYAIPLLSTSSSIYRCFVLQTPYFLYLHIVCIVLLILLHYTTTNYSNKQKHSC